MAHLTDVSMLHTVTYLTHVDGTVSCIQTVPEAVDPLSADNGGESLKVLLKHAAVTHEQLDKMQPRGIHAAAHRMKAFNGHCVPQRRGIPDVVTGEDSREVECSPKV